MAEAAAWSSGAGAATCQSYSHAPPPGIGGPPPAVDPRSASEPLCPFADLAIWPRDDHRAQLGLLLLGPHRNATRAKRDFRLSIPSAYPSRARSGRLSMPFCSATPVAGRPPRRTQEPEAARAWAASSLLAARARSSAADWSVRVIVSAAREADRHIRNRSRLAAGWESAESRPRHGLVWGVGGRCRSGSGGTVSLRRTVPWQPRKVEGRPAPGRSPLRAARGRA
jgi:hypothetical protein